MRVLGMEIKYIKSDAKLLNRDWVNKGGLDLSKNILLVSVGQREAELQAVKVGGLKKNSVGGRFWTRVACAEPNGQIFFQTSNFDSW